MAECDNYIPDILTKKLYNHKNYDFLLKAQAMLELEKQ
jgi:hypothetical protein